MYRHRIDPLSATLGLIAIGIGILVAAGRADTLVDHGGWWIAFVALLLGVALMSWGRGPRPWEADEAAPPEPPPGGSS